MMSSIELQKDLQDCVNRIEDLARRKGCEKTLEFELYVMRWGAELAASSQSHDLARSVMRETLELGAMLEGDSPHNGLRRAGEGL
ncbi:MAG: hypothetical protein WD314_02755 [Trueperaceae bacterium]